MFKSPEISNKINLLNEFLNKLADEIIQTKQNIESKQFRFKCQCNFMSVYTVVYQFCIQKPSLQQKMLQEYKNALNYFLTHFVQFQQRNDHFILDLQNSKKVIKRFNKLWVKYTKFMVVIAKKIFPYLDRYYLPGIEEGSLYKIGIQTFKKNICHQMNLSYFFRSFIKEIKEIRTFKLIQNYQLLRFTQAIAIIDMQDLLNQLIKMFFEETKNHYSQTFKKIEYYSCNRYFNAVNNLYWFEKVLFQMCICLNIFQRHAIMIIFTETLLKPITQRFVKDQNGLKKMFDIKDIQYMKLITSIYTQFEGITQIRQGYYNYLLTVGQEMLVKQKYSSISFVQIIYGFYKEHLNMITKGFGSKKSEFVVTLNNAVQKLISKKDNFTQDFYLYCKKILQNECFDLPEIKEKITILLEKLSSKDQFIGLYEADLFKKLIGKQYFNIKVQQSFVHYLNEMYGNELTHKLGKKLKDYIESPKDLSLFLDHKHFNVTILSHHLWQKKFNSQHSLNITLPKHLNDIWSKIELQYFQIEPKKKLNLLPQENKIILSIKMNKKFIQLKCNLIQAAILFFMWTKSYCSQNELINECNLQKNVVQTALEKFELIAPNLLLKSYLGDYLINWDFTPQNDSIDMNSQIAVSKDKIIKFIQHDREILIQAAIVKFIKRTKKVKFEQILVGLTNSIKLFQPQLQSVKKTLQKLIKKGYIQQIQGQMFEYVE